MKTHKPIILRFWVGSGVNSLSGLTSDLIVLSREFFPQNCHQWSPSHLYVSS